MRVIQRVGRLAGHIIDLPYAEATSCLSSGSVELPTDEQIAAYDEGGIEALQAPNATAPAESAAAEVVEPAPASDPDPAPDVLPDGWEDLHWKKIVALAEERTGQEFTNKADAVEALKAITTD